MDIEDFEVGEKVVVESGDQELNGNIESIQLKAKLVDVKIFEPGHPSHCLIKSFPPDAVTVVDEHEPHGASSYAELQKRVEGKRSDMSNDSLLSAIDKLAKEENTRLQSIEESLAALAARVEALESKKKDEPNPNEPPQADNAQGA